MIRVLRVLEYRYRDGDAMANDMRQWSIGANATYRASGGLTIASSIMLPESVPDEPDEAKR